MPKRKTTYQYGANDDPVAVASQFGVTPQQLLAANPGGSPFTVGQTINVPYQYSAPIGPQPFVGPAQPPNSVQGGRGAMLPTNPIGTVQSPILAQRGRGTNANFSGITPTGYGTDDSWYRPAQPSTSITPGTQPAAGTAAAPTPGSGDFYGYERDPETGRSVRVIKNSANSSFLKELRWDPQRRKYVSIGRLLKQGKLDLKGNWRNSTRRQRRNNNQQKAVQKQQDFTLANSFISFGASSG